MSCLYLYQQYAATFPRELEHNTQISVAVDAFGYILSRWRHFQIVPKAAK
jgi:hypothetical protein